MGLNTLNLRTCKATRSTNLAVVTGTPTAVTFDGTTIDNLDSMWLVANPTRITFNRAGIYLATGMVRWAANTGERRLQIQLNGAGILGDVLTPVTVLTGVQQVVAQFFAKAGDYIELVAFQNQGGNVNVVATAADETPSLSVTLVRPFVDYSAASQAL